MGISTLVTFGFNTGSSDGNIFRLTTFGFNASIWSDRIKVTTVWTDI